MLIVSLPEEQMDILMAHWIPLSGKANVKNSALRPSVNTLHAMRDGTDRQAGDVIFTTVAALIIRILLTPEMKPASKKLLVKRVQPIVMAIKAAMKDGIKQTDIVMFTPVHPHSTHTPLHRVLLKEPSSVVKPVQIIVMATAVA